MSVFSSDNQKGSMTVEASIVIPVVFLSIIALILLALAQFEITCVQSVANLASEAGTDSFDSRFKDVGTGKISKDQLGKDGLYRRLYDPDTALKLDKIETYTVDNTQANLKDNQVLTSTAELTDWVLYKKITVNINASDRTQKNRELPVFGIIAGKQYGTVSESVVYDPAEFIRNTDFLIDIERELECKYPGLKNLGDKTRDAILGIKNRTEDFLK